MFAGLIFVLCHLTEWTHGHVIVIDPHTPGTSKTLVCCAEEEELTRAEEQQTVLMVRPTDNDDVTDVLQMLEQELAAYEEQELAAMGGGRGGGRGGRGGQSRVGAARLEMEDLVNLAQEAARARCSSTTACLLASAFIDLYMHIQAVYMYVCT